MPTPQEFKDRILTKYPNGVTSEGVKYADLDPNDLTRRMVSKFPDGVTNDGIRYSDFLTNKAVTPPQITKTQVSNEQFKPTFQAAEDETGLSATLKVLGNVPGSGIGFVKNLARSMNPVEIMKNLQEIPKEIKALVGEAGGSKQALKYALSPKTALSTLREGLLPMALQGRGIDETRLAIQNDPVGQIAPILLGGRGVAGKLGKGAAFDTAVTKAASPVTKLGAKATAGLAQKLEKTNLRLTPTQKTNLAPKLPEITKYLAEKKIIGGPETRYNKIDSIYDSTEAILDNWLKTNNTAKGVSVSRNALIAELQKAKKTLMKDSSDAPLIDRQINSTIANLKLQYRNDKIPISRLNDLKRSTYKNAYNKGGDKVLDDVEFSTADVYKTAIEKATKGLELNGKSIAEFNKEYGTVIQARKLLKIAQGRNQLGALGRLFAGIAGYSVGGAIGGPVGGAAGVFLGEMAAKNIAGTGARSLLGAGLQTASKFRSPELTKPGAFLTKDRQFKAGLSLEKIAPEDLAIMSDFTDYVAGSYKPGTKLGQKLELDAAMIAERLGIREFKSTQALANAFGKVLESSKFKRP